MKILKLIHRLFKSKDNKNTKLNKESKDVYTKQEVMNLKILQEALEKFEIIKLKYVDVWVVKVKGSERYLHHYSVLKCYELYSHFNSENAKICSKYLAELRLINYWKSITI